MRSLTCRGDGRVALVDVPDPEPGPGDALVRIAASAVCGSERSSYVGGMEGNTGHEAAGVLEAVPAGHGFAPGERVGMSAVFGCGACARCARGQEMHCEDGPRINAGWHAEYAVVPVRTLRAIPQDLDLGLAAMMTGDPLGVPARALGRAPAPAGATVVVVGLGPVGLGHTLVRAFAGCRVIGIEPSPQRRALALALGAAEAHAPGGWGGRVPLVIECSGRPAAIAAAFELVDNGGTLLQSGECHTEIALTPSDLFIRRELTYTGAWYYGSEDYPAMRDLVARGLPLADLRTHDVAAADAQGAITDFLEARSGKVVLRWSEV